ncbi:MAG: hypothetical protein JW820_16155 [Spirochaetales bacterium]|nr:hypothetical protein [Spirochaetales bacterium]
MSETERRHRLASFPVRLILVLASFGVYAAVCLLFREQGVGLLYLVLVPVALAGALFRVPGGLIAALLGYLMSELLYRAAFPPIEGYTTVLWLLDLGVTMVIGALTGYLGGVIRRQQQLIGRLEATAHNKELLIRQNQELQERISSLSGAVPICPFCKRVRTGENDWVQVEQYLRDRSGLDFGAVVCPSCARQHERSHLEGRAPKCPLAKICGFFNRTPVSPADRELKYAYCYTEHRACEIFNRINAGHPVPEDLLPDGAIARA